MYNFKRKSDAQHAVDAARERALGVVRSARVQFAPRRVSGEDQSGSKIGITTANIFYGDSGTIAIARRSSSGTGNPVDTGERIEDVYLDHLTRDDIEENTEVKIEYFADEDLWRITGCACTPRSIGTTPPVAGF